MELGTKENPYIVAPEDWLKNGVPYSSFCKCYRCGMVARSTFTFDYYADNPGDKLECEMCKIGTPKETAIEIAKKFEEGVL